MDKNRKTVGKLTILEAFPTISSKMVYICLCSCGKELAVLEGQLKRIRDCGCGANSIINSFYLFKKSILQRDGGRCIRCGSSESLQAHHVNNSKQGKDRRFDVNNGVTLCKPCHDLYHSKKYYGKKDNNISQLYEFVTNYEENTNGR